jgi:hypothetical protein
MSEAHWTDRLSEYMDGELDRAERAMADRHLAACSACAMVLAELQELVSATALLPEVPPQRDLWPQISRRLAPRPTLAGIDPTVIPFARRKRVVLSIPQLVAAGLALMLLSAGGMWIATGRPASDPILPVAYEAYPDAFLAAYDPAMAEVEAEYQRRREELDPETILVVERNLALIDLAIREARDALTADPSSGFLSGHLAETMRRRMSLLREVASI